MPTALSLLGPRELDYYRAHASSLAELRRLSAHEDGRVVGTIDDLLVDRDGGVLRLVSPGAGSPRRASARALRALARTRYRALTTPVGTSAGVRSAAMTSLYPEIEPYDRRHAGRRSTATPSTGRRAAIRAASRPSSLHGGPGSGCTPWFRRLFDPSAYRLVLFDQRNCGRSTPHASDPDTDLEANTTANLIADIELLRRHLDVDRWLVFGGSWGSTLALAYAETHPDRVTELILFGVTTGRHEEFDWAFRGGLARLFPEQWERLRVALPVTERDGDVVEACHRLLSDPDPTVRRRAAEAWCTWESATPAWPPQTGLAERFTDPDYALAFARIVTHYVRHNAWLEDGILLRDAGALAEIPGILVNGRFDFQAPLGNAWELSARVAARRARGRPRCRPRRHDERLGRELVRATGRFAAAP